MWIIIVAIALYLIVMYSLMRVAAGADRHIEILEAQRAKQGEKVTK